MNILFIHGNYPAQFRQMASALGKQGMHDVRFLTARADAEQSPIFGVGIEFYNDVEPSAGLDAHCQAMDQAIRRGLVIQAKLASLAAEGFAPRLVIVHGGNGLALLVKQLIPNCTLIGYFEWYFHESSSQLLLNQTDRIGRNLVTLRNLSTAGEVLQCDAAVVPTRWQAQQFPEGIRQRLQIVFDGVDTSFFQPPDRPYRQEALGLSGEYAQLDLAAGEPLLSYATRGMEPLRGFPQFMRALPAVLAALPTCRVLIGGRDRSAYGCAAPSHGGSWKQMLLEELGDFPGRERIVFTGLLNYGEYRKLLHRSWLHCYFSRPYVTSWSLFEAVACGTPILTNLGEATTGMLPCLAADAVDLDCSAAELAGSIVEQLRAVEKKTCLNRLEKSFTLAACQERWEQLINDALLKQSEMLS